MSMKFNFKYHKNVYVALCTIIYGTQKATQTTIMYEKKDLTVYERCLTATLTTTVSAQY